MAVLIRKGYDEDGLMMMDVPQRRLIYTIGLSVALEDWTTGRSRVQPEFSVPDLPPDCELPSPVSRALGYRIRRRAYACQLRTPPYAWCTGPRHEGRNSAPLPAGFAMATEHSAAFLASTAPMKFHLDISRTWREGPDLDLRAPAAAT